MAEISDSELATLRASMALLKSLETKGGTKFFKAVKEILPDMKIPEVDLAAPIEQSIAELNKRFDGFEKHLKDAGSEANRIEKRAALKAEGWTDEGLTKVEEMMKKDGIGSYDAAAALFEKRNPKPKAIPAGRTSGRWDWHKEGDKDESVKALFADPESWAENETVKILDEFDAARGREE